MFNRRKSAIGDKVSDRVQVPLGRFDLDDCRQFNSGTRVYVQLAHAHGVDSLLPIRLLENASSRLTFKTRTYTYLFSGPPKLSKFELPRG